MENENKGGYVEMFVRPLDMKIGEEIYNKKRQGHTFVVVDNSVVIESTCDDRGHNKVIITQLKDYKFPEKYFIGLVAPIPKNININDIINKIEIDKGEYLPTTNSCYNTIYEILKIIEADQKTMNEFNKLCPKKDPKIDRWFKKYFNN